MKKRQMIWRVLPLMLLMFFLSSCGSKETKEVSDTSQEEKRIQIGLSFDSFVIERWIRDRDVFVSTAQELGAEVNFQTANGDVQEQISQIEYFIQKKMDVIAIIAIDGDALFDVVQKAKENGIKVVCYDRVIRNAGTDLYISFDNEMVGELMAQSMLNSLSGKKHIFIINGSEYDYNVTMVNDGIRKKLEDSQLQVDYRAYCDNWLAELAFDAVNEGLEEYDTVDGIIFGNDDLAGQGIRALTEHRMAGKVVVVAQDAELSACQRIAEGTQKMTVYKPVDELAKAAAILSVALAKGADITSAESEIPVTATFDDGKNQIPYLAIEPVAVTRDNLDEVIIGSGFHAKEDVYLNVQ